MNIPTSLGLLVALAAVSIAPAQPDDPFERELEDAENMVPRESGDLEAFSPRSPDTTKPVRPGLTAGSDWAAMLEGEWPGALIPELLPERTFVNQLRGTVIRGPEGSRVFVPTPESPDAQPRRAMLLLPCIVLDRFNQFVMADSPRAPALLTGQVFLYGDRNYILPTLLRNAWDAPEPPTDQIELPPPDLSPVPALVPLSVNRSVAFLMVFLDRGPPYAPPPPARPAETTEDAPAAPPAFVDDGVYVAARRGRIVRSPTGSWLFISDNDPGSARGAESFTLLPCRTLEGLEQIALREGDASAGLLSGRVYRYDDGLYLLPTLYQQERRDGVNPLQ